MRTRRGTAAGNGKTGKRGIELGAGAPRLGHARRLKRTTRMSTHAIHSYLQALRDSAGSDLHLSPGDLPRVRQNGIVVPLPTARVLTSRDVAALVEPIAPERALAGWRTDLQADFSYDGGPELGQFRIIVYQSRAGHSAVVRAVPRLIPTADDLGLPDPVQNLVHLHSGLVLVVGRAGEGKSTTLAWFVNQINQTRGAHIVTFEDPVEYQHQPALSAITQRELGTDVHSFADALRAAMRQGPDVIVIGEIRDTETLALALRAAESGHLVLATLHAPSAALTPSRVLDLVDTHRQEQTRRQLAECLRAVVSQTLVPRKGKPGRRAAFEVLLRNDATSQIIRTGHGDLEGPMGILDSGMQTLNRALTDLVLQDWITVETALAYSRTPERLRAALMQCGMSLSR